MKGLITIYKDDFVNELVKGFMTDENSAELVEKLKQNRVDDTEDVSAKVDAAVKEAVATNNKSWNQRFRETFMEGGSHVETTPAGSTITEAAGKVTDTIGNLMKWDNLFKTESIEEYNAKK